VDDDAPGDRYRMTETRTSVLFFMGDRVYKMTKPSGPGFGDGRSVASREAAAHKEVDLNRRIAPDVYLGVADVFGPRPPAAGSGLRVRRNRDATRVAATAPLEHIVVMRRLPADRQLAAMVRERRATAEDLQALARLLAAFHDRSETSDEIARSGAPRTLRRLWREGITRVTPFVGEVLKQSTIEEIDRLAARYIDGRGPLLRERQTAGRIRDGHGDLTADDIFLLDDGPRVLDGETTDPRLRLGDVLGDVALLAMDLERLGAPRLAEAFLDAYRAATGDTYPASLRDLYVAYRGLMGCAHACARHTEGDPNAAVEARRFAALAADHLRRARVRLVLLGGLPGTGKSTLARALAEDAGTRAGTVLILRPDAMGRDFPAGGDYAGAAPGDDGAVDGPREDDPTGDDGGEVGGGELGGEREEANARGYDDMFRRARHALEHGETVILDASWSSARQRSRAARLAARTSSELVELRCVAPREIVEQRIAAGRDAGEPLGATLASHDALAGAFAPWPDALEIDTSIELPRSVAAARHAVG
jgi:uncharacterized protein